MDGGGGGAPGRGWLVRGVAVVLARGGSKGVPGKNLRPVAGRPCVAWTIEAALRAREAGAVDAAGLSTDSPALLAVAGEMGAEPVQRPVELATDTARVDAAAAHAVAELERRSGPMRDDGAVVILYGNVPVRPAGLIERAVALLRESGCDSVQSYAPVGKHHPWWTARLDSAGLVKPWEGDVLNHGVHRRQDLPPAWVPDGGVLVVRRGVLMAAAGRVTEGAGGVGPHEFFGRDRRGVRNPEGAVVDIDTELDLLVADAILRGAAAKASGVQP